ncbi:MAG: acyl carrier protein [Polyangiaceae bacterium]|nr:acyl carrier protein [Polyangiaceae bacterium]
MNLTADLLIDYITKTLEVEDVEVDTPLFSSGLLDSVTMLDLIAFIEKKARIEVEREDVTLDNFDTVERIVRFAGSKA